MSTAAASTGEALAEEFEKLYREHCHFVYRTAYAITGNRQDAEDVLQSIFVKLLEREALAELAGNPRAYLHRAAVNLSLNALRSRRRRKATENIDELTTPPIAANGFEECADDDLHERLLDAITSLKPKAAEVLLLHYKKMLQTLLAERFKLVMRRESREMDSYVLIVARGVRDMWNRICPKKQI